MAMAFPTVSFDTPVSREYLGEHGIYAATGDARFKERADYLVREFQAQGIWECVGPDGYHIPTVPEGHDRLLERPGEVR